MLSQNDFSKIFKIEVTDPNAQTNQNNQAARRLRILEKNRRKFGNFFSIEEKKMKRVFKIHFNSTNGLRYLQTNTADQNNLYSVDFREGSQNSATMEIDFASSVEKAKMKISVEQPYLTYQDQEFPIAKFEEEDEVEVVSFILTQTKEEIIYLLYSPKILKQIFFFNFT